MPLTLKEVEKTFAIWIRDEDPIPTRAVLAAYVANRRLDGDPVWLMLVGGSGVGKTERLIPLSVMPDVVLESSITGPAALLSGTGKKERAKNATGGLLRKLPEGGGILLLKDFTSIIDMHRDSRAEVLAALREIYDGRWDRSVGADGGRTLTWTGRLGIMAGCTTAIDSAHSVISIMGTRFLLVRLYGDPNLAGSAFDHVGHEQSMRDELRAAVRHLLEHLPGVSYDKADVRGPLIALASYVARARSPVDRDQRSEIRLVLDPEAPTRIVKMLTQLWQAAGLLGLAKPDAWSMVRRIGLDSIPKLRREVLDVLAEVPSATIGQIAELVRHPLQTTRRALEDLAVHHAVTRDRYGKTDHWQLHPEARAWLEQTVPVLSHTAMVVPVSSQPPHALSERKRSDDDKTGKVSGTGG
jgi:DNA-binding transcriptional ArsR family regulator